MRPRSTAVLVVAALLAGACAGSRVGMDPGAAGGGAGPSATTQPDADGEEPVAAILDFEARLVGGGTIRGAELAGAPVAVWFWAPW